MAKFFLRSFFCWNCFFSKRGLFELFPFWRRSRFPQKAFTKKFYNIDHKEANFGLIFCLWHIAKDEVINRVVVVVVLFHLSHFLFKRNLGGKKSSWPGIKLGSPGSPANISNNWVTAILLYPIWKIIYLNTEFQKPCCRPCASTCSSLALSSASVSTGTFVVDNSDTLHPPNKFFNIKKSCLMLASNILVTCTPWSSSLEAPKLKTINNAGRNHVYLSVKA